MCIAADSPRLIAFWSVILLNSRVGQSSENVLFNLVLYAACAANSTDVIKPCYSHGVSARLNTPLLQRVAVVLRLGKIFHTFSD
uniref:Secreted protein n=1 Tax=Physcomitrium patens TaxID=3218 RepID=A0A2K1JKJ4_PHYPA|nr:hypothetical protein PHYPA_016890 [Physcomitrium patens]